VVNNEDLNKKIGLGQAAAEAVHETIVARDAVVVQDAKFGVKENINDAKIMDAATADDSTTSNVKTWVGRASNGEDGKPQKFSVDAVVVMHFHQATGIGGLPAKTEL